LDKCVFQSCGEEEKGHHSPSDILPETGKAERQNGFTHPASYMKTEHLSDGSRSIAQRRAKNAGSTYAHTITGICSTNSCTCMDSICTYHECCNAGCRQWAADFPWLCAMCAPTIHVQPTGNCSCAYAQRHVIDKVYSTIPNIRPRRLCSHYVCLHGMYAHVMH
jgi:hypothetical protein